MSKVVGPYRGTKLLVQKPTSMRFSLHEVRGIDPFQAVPVNTNAGSSLVAEVCVEDLEKEYFVALPGKLTFKIDYFLVLKYK